MERRRSFLTGWRLDAAREMEAFQLANLLAAGDLPLLDYRTERDAWDSLF